MAEAKKHTVADLKEAVQGNYAILQGKIELAASQKKPINTPLVKISAEDIKNAQFLKETIHNHFGGNYEAGQEFALAAADSPISSMSIEKFQEHLPTLIAQHKAGQDFHVPEDPKQNLEKQAPEKTIPAPDAPKPSLKSKLMITTSALIATGKVGLATLFNKKSKHEDNTPDSTVEKAVVVETKEKVQPENQSTEKSKFLSAVRLDQFEDQLMADDNIRKADATSAIPFIGVNRKLVEGIQNVAAGKPAVEKGKTPTETEQRIASETIEIMEAHFSDDDGNLQATEAIDFIQWLEAQTDAQGNKIYADMPVTAIFAQDEKNKAEIQRLLAEFRQDPEARESIADGIKYLIGDKSDELTGPLKGTALAGLTGPIGQLIAVVIDIVQQTFGDGKAENMIASAESSLEGMIPSIEGGIKGIADQIKGMAPGQ